LYYLQKYRYDGFLTSDTSPTRLDIRRTFETNARMTNKIWNLLNDLDRDDLDALIAGDDYLKTWAFIEEKILRL
jgi:xylose isomerase